VKKDIKWEEHPSKASQLVRVFVTACGNFGILAYESGVIVKINMQSGMQQITFQKKVSDLGNIPRPNLTIDKVHSSPITGVFVDSYNKVLVSSDSEYLLVNWDFYSGNVQKIISTYPSRITFMKHSKTSSLFCCVFEDSKIELYDQYSFNRARVFIGHKGRIMDACFTVNNKQVVSCGLDCTIKVWDIISGLLINNLKVKAPVTSLDFDPSGDFLVTSFANSKEIFIWTNKIGKDLMGGEDEIPVKFVSDIKMKEWGHKRKKFMEKAKVGAVEEKQFDDKAIEDLKNFIEECCAREDKEQKQSMVGLLEQDIGRWIPLIYLDEIKEKNKPKKPVENNPVAPFFLEFDSRVSELNAKMEGIIPEEKKVEKTTRIIKKNERNEFLEEIGSALERLVTKAQEKGSPEIFDKIFKEMKKLGPSQIDYEVRKITFGNIPAVINYNLISNFLD